MINRRRKRKLPRLGTGKRFKSLARRLKKKGAETPDALAAWIGRRKWGKTRFKKLSQHRR